MNCLLKNKVSLATDRKGSSLYNGGLVGERMSSQIDAPISDRSSECRISSEMWQKKNLKVLRHGGREESAGFFDVKSGTPSKTVIACTGSWDGSRDWLKPEETPFHPFKCCQILSHVLRRKNGKNS